MDFFSCRGSGPVRGSHSRGVPEPSRREDLAACQAMGVGVEGVRQGG